MMRTSKKLKRKDTPSATVKPHQGCPSAFVMKQTCFELYAVCDASCPLWLGAHLLGDIRYKIHIYIVV